MSGEVSLLMQRGVQRGTRLAAEGLMDKWEHALLSAPPRSLPERHILDSRVTHEP
jgi:hypothetical protein